MAFKKTLDAYIVNVFLINLKMGRLYFNLTLIIFLCPKIKACCTPQAQVKNKAQQNTLKWCQVGG